MCGIAGIALKPGRALPDMQRRLAAMRDAMQHRGPDDAGIYLAPDAMLGLVNCRLAIRDLSPAGHMPMATADRQFWISYNGEIYNADELRACLVQQGYNFCSQSDTEVILLGYQAWGAQVLERLRGMFAFALLDNRDPAASHLLLARDRLGIKPLYYAPCDAGLVFASELKALLSAGLVAPAIDPTALVAYLMLGSVPDPLSIYRGVRVLEPACSLHVSLAAQHGHTPEPRRYWQFPAIGPGNLSPTEAVEQVAVLLEDAVRSHLVSDVPLGAFLSGGLDSSSVVALMHALGAAPIRTCSMSFEEAAYNEADYAATVAEATGSEHYARVITVADVQANLERIWRAMDQPSIDGVNSYFVAQTAREAGLTVALSGLGGDELFGGYPNTFESLPRLLAMTRRIQRIPAMSALASQVLSLPPVHRRWLKIAAALQRPASTASAYIACRGLFAPGEVRSLVSAEAWQEAMTSFDPVARVAENLETNDRTDRADKELDLFNWISRAELRHYTSRQLLRDTDVMSMAHSLEVRVPLLDDRLVEAVLCMPASVKALPNGHGPKPLLAQAIGARLPTAVRERRDKRGFTFPFDVWLRGPLRGSGAAPPSALQGLLRPAGIIAVQRGFDAGKVHWSRRWALAVLDGWGALVP